MKEDLAMYFYLLYGKKDGEQVDTFQEMKLHTGLGILKDFEFNEKNNHYDREAARTVLEVFARLKELAAPDLTDGQQVNKALDAFDAELGTVPAQAEDAPAKLEDYPENSIDAVLDPNHYKSHPSGVECWDIVEHMSYNIGTAMAYLWRAGLKPGTPATVDYGKAIKNIEREIKLLEKRIKVK